MAKDSSVVYHARVGDTGTVPLPTEDLKTNQKIWLVLDPLYFAGNKLNFDLGFLKYYNKTETGW